MEAVEFSFGGDAVIRAGETVLRGVTRARLSESSDCYEIMEFLTDKPVARLASPRYTLELRLRAPRGFEPEAALSAESFSLTEGGTTVTLEGCVRVSLDRELLPNKHTEYTAVIAACDRRVSHE